MLRALAAVLLPVLAAPGTATAAEPDPAPTGFRLGAHVDRGTAADVGAAAAGCEEALGCPLDVHRCWCSPAPHPGPPPWWSSSRRAPRPRGT